MDIKIYLFREFINAGKTHQFKYIDIPLPDEYWRLKANNEWIKQYLSEYEEDGYIGRAYDFSNSNNINHNDNTIRVLFERYVLCVSNI
jgi:hypothetical protein